MTFAVLLADAFGWRGPVSVSPGARGATGRISRVEAGGSTYALKESFFEQPTPGQLEAEVAFVTRAIAAGVRAPLPRADRAGRYLVPGPDGAWLRLYEWVDVSPLDLDAPDTPRLVGELLARLHRAGPASSVEPDGSAPHEWYRRPPDVAAFAGALAHAAPWRDRLASRVADIPELLEVVEPIDETRLILCHRDLHPGNVLQDSTGSPVVIDWDNLGPADPSRELAEALFDWWCDASIDAPAMSSMYDSYRAAGGPGRVTSPADFTMLVCVRLNFLLSQLGVAMDERADAEHRAWAEQEIDESLRFLPTRAQLTEALTILSNT